MVYLGFPGVPFDGVVQFYVSLDSRDHPDHGLLGYLEIAAQAAVGALIERRRLDEVLSSDQESGVLWTAQSLATAESNQVSAYLGIVRQILCRWKLGCRIHKKRKACPPGDGDAFF